MLAVNPDNVLHYLAERRLMTVESAVDGDFMVLDQSSRNRNLKVLRRRSPGFFLKQARYRNPAYLRTLEREAACYGLAARHPELAGLAGLMPRLHHYDAANGLLVLEMLPNAETLWEHHLRAGGFPLAIAELQGERLGAFQRQAERFQPQLEALELFDRQVPWILSIHQTHPQYLSQMSQGNAQLLQILQQYPEFTAALDAIRRAWAPRMLVHGDVKWENLILCRAGEETPLELRMIDWEMADLGDECWDVGAIVQAYFTFWIFMLPLGPGVSLEQAAATSTYRAEDMQAALAAFWKSYARARVISGRAERRLLERTMASAAARMIQTAYEAIQQSQQMTPQGLCQLQMSMNVLHDPAAAAQEIAGLGGAAA
ncbi:MAG TPA: phosphotransferase [Thermoanaerobaculia bacterium]|jgi:thiamine kinase-like enzyme